MESLRDYAQDLQLAKQFFSDVTHLNEQAVEVPKYAEKLTQIANREVVHLLVELEDVERFNNDLARHITTHVVRAVQIFYEALDEILPSYKTKEPEVKDPMDVFIEQRLQNSERWQRSAPTGQQHASQSASINGVTVDIEGKYPTDLIRRVEISFKPSSLKSVPIREVTSQHIGHMVTVRGIVTRCTEVKPRVTIVTYTCDQCGYESFQPVGGYDFTPLVECTSAACKSNKSMGRLFMQTRGSKFIKFQEMRLQEHSDHVPKGNLPRTLTIAVCGELTRLCVPGDHISVSGVFLPVEKSSFRMRTGGLAADTMIQPHYISLMNKTEDDELNGQPMSHEEAMGLLSGGNFLFKLSSSIAPEIYGHENLKKALLLLLVGGVDRSPYGMKIRGNINICLMGDPGVAKSQLLSFIDRLAARSQYTTGRGSSGVGLTAAVLKDPVTNELVLEGGALVLADEGICCIDEFDKMMDADRTAIHEVMEQQTVSIAKAGIMTTLNARVSILAAANPAYGRYNIHKSITDNLQLPPALLSRFDLLWLIRDMPDDTKDQNLALHITHIHKDPDQEVPSEFETIDMKVMRRYIALCKTKNPIIPEFLTDKLVEIYLDIRSRKRTSISGDSLFTSPRSLLAVIRLSTAFARLRLSDVVEEADIRAAVMLYNSCRESIEGASETRDTVSRFVLDLLREMSDESEKPIDMSEFIRRTREAEIPAEDVKTALDELHSYESIYIEGGKITLIAN